MSHSILAARPAGPRDHERLLGPLTALALAGVAVTFFLIRLRHGLWFLPFNDEAEHLLGGKALDSGYRLYASFVDTHGPFIFLLTQAFGVVFGWAEPNDARLIIGAFAFVAAGCVAASPSLDGIVAKLWGVSLFLGLLASVWLLQGLYLVSFYPVAGLLAVAGLAGFVAGGWSGRAVPAWIAVLSGIAFALLVSTAYSFGPSAVLFAASGTWAALQRRRHRTVLAFVIGGALGSCAMLVWLLRYGDLVGYLAFHVALNQTAYAPYIDFTVGHFVRSLTVSANPSLLVHSFALLACAGSALLFFAIDQSRPAGQPRQRLPITLGYAGVLLLNARGLTHFGDGTFLVASLGLLAVAIPTALARFAPRGDALVTAGLSGLLGVGIAGVELAGHHALNTPGGLTRAEMARQPQWRIYHRADDPVFNEVRRLVPPNDPVLALPYWPNFYWHADRLPLDGYYEYLPWDARYATSPWLGRDRDLCVALAKSPPAVIAFNDWTVWDRYAPSTYMPCVLRILAEGYTRFPLNPQIYIRAGMARSAEKSAAAGPTPDSN